MGHYAFLNEDNIVTEVITGVNESELIEGLNPEIWYGNFRGQACKRTSYNTHQNMHKFGGVPFRGNYAAIGYKYDENLNVFIPPQPYPSWKLDYTIYDWVPPIPKPEPVEGYFWIWSEVNQEWVSIPI
jgi:hypothetical protein